jgi:putative zinc finger protein
MNCAGCKELFSEYIDGVLDSDTKAQLEEHVLQCTVCRRILEDLKTLVGELRAVEPVKAPADFLDRLHERIEPRFSFGKVIKTLFIPMRIKIPVQLVTAMATVVLVFSIINLQQPEKLLKDAPMMSEKEESKPELMKEPAEPLPERKIYTPKSAFKKTVAHKKPKTRKAKDIASKGLKTEKLIELALVLKTDTYRKPALKNAPLKAAPPVESSEVDYEEQKAYTRSFSRSRIAGKAVTKEEVVAGAVKKDKKAATPLSAQPAELKEEVDEPESDVDKITKQLKKLIKDLNGEIESIEYSNKTGHPISLTAVIPVDKYSVFYGKLKEMGTLHGPEPAVKERKKEMIRIQLVISK